MVNRAEMEDEFERRQPLYQRANDAMRSVIEALLDDLSKQYGFREGFVVVGQPKSFKSFYAKAIKKKCATANDAFAEITDLSRLRVVCHTLDDCSNLLEMLRQQALVFVDETSIQDYIETPSETGYRAIHVNVAIDVPLDGEPVSIPVELQIRSALQEAWGHFTHSDFYKGSTASPLVSGLMKEFSDLLYWSDRHAARLIREMAAAQTMAETARSEDAQPSP